jgi:hypothetical protein
LAPPPPKIQRDSNEIKGGITRRKVTAVVFAALIRAVSALVPRIDAIRLTTFLRSFRTIANSDY